MTTRNDDDKKVFLLHHTLKHQYYERCCFERGSIVTEKKIGMTSYTNQINMNQDHLMQPGLKDQQYWILWATLIFGGTGAINFQN